MARLLTPFFFFYKTCQAFKEGQSLSGTLTGDLLATPYLLTSRGHALSRLQICQLAVDNLGLWSRLSWKTLEMVWADCVGWL